MDKLSKDTKHLLKTMYANYLKKRETGQSKTQAAQFGNAHQIKQDIMPQWPFEDVLFACFELRSNGYLVGTPGSDSLLYTQLTAKAISELEAEPKTKFLKGLDLASKIKNAIL